MNFVTELPWLRALCELGTGCAGERLVIGQIATLVFFATLFYGTFFANLGLKPNRKPLSVRVMALITLSLLLSLLFYFVMFLSNPNSEDRSMLRIIRRCHSNGGFLFYSTIILGLSGFVFGILIQCWRSLVKEIQ